MNAIATTTLLEKIGDGHTDLVFEYLAQATGAPNYGELLRACAYYGDVSAMRYALANGATLAALGQYPLNTAAFHGHWRLCQFLIDSGINVDDPVAETGETSLHSAFGLPHGPAYEPVVKVLLVGGANVNASTIPGVRTEAFTHSKTRGETALHRAAAFGTLTSVEMLLKHGADVNAKDARGETPLEWASWHRHPLPEGILEKLRGSRR
jgi:ankyrin repeat protein